MSICQRACKNCLLKKRCGGCSLCNFAFCDKSCGLCFSLCPEYDKAFEYVSILQKRQFGNITKKEFNIQLPDIIPIVPDRNVISKYPYEVIGVHAGNFFTSNGENISPVYIKKGFQVQGKEGVLQFYVKDRTLEGFWSNRKKIYDQLKLFRWRAIIAPNFSVYEDAPRIDHLRNIERSRIVFDELVQNEFPAIPDISWYNKNDLDYWGNYINEQNIRTIAFSFQVVGTGIRAGNTFVNYAMGLDYLLKKIPNNVDVIIAGITSPKRLELIKSCGIKNRMIIINQAAFVHSRRGQLSRTGKSEKGITKNDLFLKNLEYYESEYRRVNNAKT